MKYQEIYVIEGKITVPVADKNGKIIGSTELLLERVMIKIPQKEMFGFNPEIKNLWKRRN